MGKLIIEGEDNALASIAKRSRLLIRRAGLTVVLESKEDKTEEETKLSASEVIQIIKGASSLTELEAYGEDTRVTVQKELKSKKEELAQ